MILLKIRIQLLKRTKYFDLVLLMSMNLLLHVNSSSSVIINFLNQRCTLGSMDCPVLVY